ncbi:MAG: hypothetical protein HYS23_01570 [Geobacter sp.]|nr:hypothetical protein [Geobacter sp.]
MKKHADLQKKMADIKEKRLAFLTGLWNLLVEEGFINPNHFALSQPLIDEVVNHYVDDWAILKTRYNIPDEVQLHKVAGLMAAAFVRFRPIIPLVTEYDDKREIYVNEFFAVLHGVAICGEHSTDAAQQIVNYDWFNYWFDDFLHLLHRRNYTAESLCFIFETLSIFVFPKNLSFGDA